MTPERLKELKEIFSGDEGRDALEWIGGDEVRDLLAIAEREALLRINIQTIATICEPDAAKLLRAALETKGGE